MFSKFLIVSLLMLSSMGSIAQHHSVKAKLEKVSLAITDAKGELKTIDFKLRFPSEVANTGSEGESQALSTLKTQLLKNSVTCPPKRKKIADNTWICGDGTKYTSNDKKLTALLDELWSENE